MLSSLRRIRPVSVGRQCLRLFSNNHGGLSVSEARQYAEEGWVIPDFEVDSKQIENLRVVLDQLIDENPGVPPEQLVSVHVAGLNAEGVKGSSAFLDLAKNERILDLVESVIGPDIILWGCQAFCKPAGTGMEACKKLFLLVCCSCIVMRDEAVFWPGALSSGWPLLANVPFSDLHRMGGVRSFES